MILFASSRSDGNTKKAIDAIFSGVSIPLVDLTKKNISFFDYDFKNENDDFIPLVEEILKYKSLIFASPTYWYIMCAQMKVFFDRLSDLLITRKDLGMRLRDKNVFVVTSYGTTKSHSFEDAFRLTAEYLGMKYHGCHFDYCGHDTSLLSQNLLEREHFLETVKKVHG